MKAKKLSIIFDIPLSQSNRFKICRCFILLSLNFIRNS